MGMEMGGVGGGAIVVQKRISLNVTRDITNNCSASG